MKVLDERKKFTTNLSKTTIEEYFPILRSYYNVKHDNEVIEKVIKLKVDDIIHEMETKK